MLKRLLIGVLLLVSSFRAVAQETMLVPGQLASVTIDASVQAPSLNFTATAGQRLGFQVVSVTGDLFPILTIYTTDGEILQYVGNPARSTTLEAAAVIPLTAIYRLELWSTDSISGQVILQMEDLTVGPALPVSTPDTAVPAVPTLSPVDTGTNACTVTPNTTLPVNVREGPSAVFRPVAALSAGEALIVTGRDGLSDWYQVQIGDASGWVAASVTRLEGDCANLEAFAIRIPTLTPTPTPTPTATPTFTPTSTATPTPEFGFATGTPTPVP